MQKIGASTTSANAASEFTEGNPGAGVPATLLKAAWLNTIQRELIRIVEGAGLALDPADDAQVLKAIQAIQSKASTWERLGGKPNTVAGFGITDAYTVDQVNRQINYRVLRDSITVVGLANNDPNLPFMLRESDDKPYFLQPRLGYQPLQQGGGIGQLANKVMIGWSEQGLKAQVDGQDLGVLWSAHNFNPNGKADKVSTDNALAQCIKFGQSIPARSNPKFGSNESGPISYLTTGTGALEIHNGGAANASAVMVLNRQGVFATYLGLDTDNQLKIGGWSMGNAAHTIWHSGNSPKNTASLGPVGWKKDADTGEILQWTEVVIGEISNSRVQSVSWPTAFPNAFLNAQISFRQGASTLPCNISAAYSNPTQSGCTVRIDEWSGIDQGTSLTLIIEARGY